MQRILKRTLPALVTVCLLCGCNTRPEKAAAKVCASAPVTESVTAAHDVPEEEAAAAHPQEDRGRTFTDADFHFYLGTEGAREEGRINVAFYPDNRDADGKPDPDIRVWDSCLITRRTEQREICSRILASPLYDPALYGRTLESMLTEWAAHNDINALHDNERTKHVDFNRADEGVSYDEFWTRAVKEILGR